MPEYIYGIVEASAAAPPGNGVAGAPVRVIGGDRAAVLVSDLPSGELRLSREDMMAHARVLEGALAGGTVLPMRFGIVMDPDEVQARVLQAHGDDLRAQLERLAGKVEMNVRVLYEQEPLMRELVKGDRRIAALRERVHGRSEDATYYDRIQLGELVAQALERKREVDAGELLGALSAASLAVEVVDGAHERVVLSASFLLARDQIGEFDDTLEALAATRAGRMRFKCVGPLPPHSFVRLQEV
jgi:Gas vesicle synthesis protein GvpL/GvpF